MSLSKIDCREAVLHELRALSNDARVVVDEEPSIAGVDSGGLRTFSLSARITLPLTELLAVVDIHTGAPAADLQWLDSLLAKSADVSADLVVAVSSAGFDDAATRLAERARVRLWVVTQPDLRRHSLFFDERLPSDSLMQLIDAGLHPLIERHDAEALTQSGEPLVLEVVGRDSALVLTEICRHISDADPTNIVPSVYHGAPRLYVEVLLSMPRRSGFALQVRAGSCGANVAAVYLVMVVGEDHTFAFDRNLKWTSPGNNEVLYLSSTTCEGDVYVNTAGRHPFLGICVNDPGVPLLSTPKGNMTGQSPLESIRMFVDPRGLVHTTGPDVPINPPTCSELGDWLASRDLVSLMDFAAPPPRPDSFDQSGSTPGA